MSLHEELTRTLANGLSRRRFLKSVGAFVTGLGLAMTGVKSHAAHVNTCSRGCCPGQLCGGDVQPMALFVPLGIPKLTLVHVV